MGGNRQDRQEAGGSKRKQEKQTRALIKGREAVICHISHNTSIALSAVCRLCNGRLETRKHAPIPLLPRPLPPPPPHKTQLVYLI